MPGIVVQKPSYGSRSSTPHTESPHQCLLVWHTLQDRPQPSQIWRMSALAMLRSDPLQILSLVPDVYANGLKTLRLLLRGRLET